MYQQGLWFVYSSIGQIPSKPSYKRTLFKYHVGIIFIPSIQRNHLEKFFQNWKMSYLVMKYFVHQTRRKNHLKNFQISKNRKIFQIFEKMSYT